MSLFERIQKKIIIESSSDTTGQNKGNRNRKKKFSSSISRTVNPNQQQELPLIADPVKDVKTTKDIIGDRKKQGRPFGSKNKPKPEPSPYQQQELPFDDGNEKSVKKRAPRKGVDYFFDPDKAKADREKLIVKRKEYGIDRKGNISDAGVERYARKTKQLSSGSNLPVNITQADKDLAKKRLTDKYGRNLPRKRPSNAKSLEQIQKEIDSRPPDARTTRNKPKLIKTKVSDKEIQDLIKQGRQTKPTKTKRITAGTLGARDKAIKDLDDLIIEPKKDDITKTKKLIKKERKKVIKNITSPKPDEIKIQKNIIKQGPKATPFVTSDTKSLDDFIKAKDPFNVKGEKPKGSSTGGGPNQNPEYQKLLNQQRRNNQAYDAFDDSDAGRPGTGNTIDNTTTRNRTSSKPETKSSKKFNGKSFDDFLKDAKKKNKKLEKEIKSLRTKSFVPPTRTIPNTNPFKFERIKNINRTRPIKTGTFRTTKAPKFSKTRTASKLAKYALGAYVVSQAFGGRGPGILPAGDRRPEIVKGKGGDIDFTLAGSKANR